MSKAAAKLPLRPAVFLDRDGTINVEKNYLHRRDDWEWITGAVDSIAAFNAAGFQVVVVSNQAGIARGFYDASDVDRLHEWVASNARAKGAHIDAFYYCPHHPDAGTVRICDCRKPKPGLILQAQKELGIDLAGSHMIGDKLSDVEAAIAAGIKPILVATGYGRQEAPRRSNDVPFVENIWDAYELIVKHA